MRKCPEMGEKVRRDVQSIRIYSILGTLAHSYEGTECQWPMTDACKQHSQALKVRIKCTRMYVNEQTLIYTYVDKNAYALSFSVWSIYK